MPGLRPQPAAGCLNLFGSTVGRSALLMAGLNGSVKETRSPYFIHRKDGQPILMAAIGSTPFERGDEAEGFLIVTAAADKGLVDIHDRRPLVLVPDAAREWMKQDVSGKEAEEIAADGAVSADHFLWHPVTRAVGNV